MSAANMADRLTVAHAAAQYVAAGWALVAIEAGTKGPSFAGWNTREKCITTTEGAVRLRASVGLAHAYSGTCALDVDRLAEARDYFRARGLNLDLYLGAADRVGIVSGKADRAKLLFSVPLPLVSCKVETVGADGKRRALFEFRCATRDGLTVQDVLPPSLHPETGAPYRWDLGPHVTACTVPPPLPPELALLWREVANGRSSVESTAGLDPLDMLRTPTGLTLDQVAPLLEHVDPAGYDDWLRIGMGLHHEFGDDGLDTWDAWSSRAHNYAGREDLERRWEGFGRRVGPPITLRYLLRRVKEAGGQVPSSSAPAPLYDPPPDDGGPIPLPPDPSAPASAPAAKAAPARFQFRAAVEFAAQAFVRWLIRGLMPEGALGVVYGEPGSGKSFWVLDVVAALARGVPWRDLRVKRAVRVAYIVAEGAGGFRLRLRAYAQANDLELADLPIILTDDPPSLLDAAHVRELVAQVRAAGGCDVLVVDTLAQVTPGANENSSEDMGRALAHCRALHRALRCFVLLVHHSGKDASKGARGWSGIRGALDLEVEIVRAGEAREAVVRKLKDGEDGARFPFRLEPVVVGTDEDGAELVSCRVVHVEHEAVGGPRRKLPTDRERIVWDVLCSLAGDPLDPTPADVSEVLGLAAERFPHDPTKRDQRRARALRALEGLADKGYAVIEGEAVRVL